MERVANTCRNCGISGHVYRECFHPIMSFGIICYRIIDNKVEYVMIQRKDSLCFMEFVRGKYDVTNTKYIQTLVSNMTGEERAAILTTSFDELWNQVWFQPSVPRHTQEYIDAKTRYNSIMRLDFINLIKGIPIKYSEPEWGFPKGRRKLRENDLDCAVREFCEETGYNRDDIAVIDMPPLEEVFIGTNNIIYRHVYFIAKLQQNHNKDITVDPLNIHQAREVRRVSWFSYEEAIRLIRDHNLERKNLFFQANEIVKSL